MAARMSRTRGRARRTVARGRRRPTRMSRRRTRCSRARDLCQRAARCRRRSGGGSCQSPSTSAWRMNSSRAVVGIDPAVADGAAGDDRQPVERDPLGGHRRARRGVPPRLAVAALVTRWAPSCSAHSGWMRATVRAHRRLVSTSSAAITHRGGFLASAEPGAMAKRASRAPEVLARARGRARPMCDSRPASSERWIAVGVAGSAFGADAERRRRPGAAGCRGPATRGRAGS